MSREKFAESRQPVMTKHSGDCAEDGLGIEWNGKGQIGSLAPCWKLCLARLRDSTLSRSVRNGVSSKLNFGEPRADPGYGR